MNGNLSQNTLDYLKSYRQTHPKYKYVEDDYLYKVLRQEDKIPNIYKDKNTEKSLGYTSDITDDFNGFAKMLDGLGSYLPDIDWVKAGWERSLTGKVRQWQAGEGKSIKAEDYNISPDLNPVEDILATAISFAMPLDVLTLGIGSIR